LIRLRQNQSSFSGYRTRSIAKNIPLMRSLTVPSYYPTLPPPNATESQIPRYHPPYPSIPPLIHSTITLSPPIPFVTNHTRLKKHHHLPPLIPLQPQTPPQLLLLPTLPLTNPQPLTLPMIPLQRLIHTTPLLTLRPLINKTHK